MGNPLFYLLLCLFILQACDQDATQASEPDVWSVASALNQWDYRFNRGDTLLADPEKMLDFFPDVWGNFVRKEQKSGSVNEKRYRWSEAQSVYFQTDRGFLDMYLADYSADKEAYSRLIHTYMQVQDIPEKHQGIWPEDQRGVFAWQWMDVRNHIHYLEAGAFARFHILIRTDLPESTANLEQAWQQLNWEAIRNLPERK